MKRKILNVVLDIFILLAILTTCAIETFLNIPKLMSRDEHVSNLNTKENVYASVESSLEPFINDSVFDLTNCCYSYIPLITGGKETEAVENKESIKDYGAVGDGTTDDWQAIQNAIDEGGVVAVPPGEYAISQTLVISENGVTLSGSGTGWVAYMYGYPPDNDAVSSIKWIGEPDGTMIKFGDGIEPNAGCRFENILLNGNNLASALLIADATYYLKVDNLIGINWRNGYGIIIKHSDGVRGSGEKYHTWTHINLLNPSEGGSGIDIAPEGSLNVNQVTFTSCNIARANINDSNISSLRMGYADHISFFRCVFMPNQPASEWRDYQRLNPYAITVQPIENHRHFPMNIAFYGTSIYGGINYVNENLWLSNGYSSLLFYPYYTADSQVIPPSGYINGLRATLPAMLVGGYTDKGVSLK